MQVLGRGEEGRMTSDKDVSGGVLELIQSRQEVHVHSKSDTCETTVLK